MTTGTVRLRGRPAEVKALHPGSFGEEPIGAILAPGTIVTKVTNQTVDGPRRYVGLGTPPTRESAVRHLVLPPENAAEQLRVYRVTEPVLVVVGTAAGSPTKEFQLELQDAHALEEVSRSRIPYDFEIRISNVARAVAKCGVGGLALGAALGNPWLGLIIGVVVGFFLGLLWPTDWKDLAGLFFGAVSPALMLLPV